MMLNSWKDVRIAASESLPYLLECASIRGEQYVAEMWGNYICPNLLKAIEIEPEQSVLPEHLNSLAKVRLGLMHIKELIVIITTTSTIMILLLKLHEKTECKQIKV